MVTQFRKNGLQFLVLENDSIRTTFLPAIGGKMVELTNKRSGTQFLLQPAHEYTKTRLPFYGADYYQYDPSGFDECFPTIINSFYPLISDDENQKVIRLPDQGELWGIPWEYHLSADALYLSVQGVRVNYQFTKKIHLAKAMVYIDYQLINLSPSPLVYIWSAQPLLKAQPGTFILLEEDVDAVLLDWATDNSIGHPGQYLPWPTLLKNQRSNYSGTSSSKSQQSMKLYTDTLKTGTCGYMCANTGETLYLKFDPQKIPYVGILLWYNGLPGNPEKELDVVALQPSSGRTDTLQEAFTRNEHNEIAAFGMDEWDLQIALS